MILYGFNCAGDVVPHTEIVEGRITSYVCMARGEHVADCKCNDEKESDDGV